MEGNNKTVSDLPRILSAYNPHKAASVNPGFQQAAYLHPADQAQQAPRSIKQLPKLCIDARPLSFTSAPSRTPFAAPLVRPIPVRPTPVRPSPFHVGMYPSCSTPDRKHGSPPLID